MIDQPDSHERSSTFLCILIFLTCLLMYLLFWSGRHYSIDGIVMFEYAKTLLFDHSFQINPPIFWANQELHTSVWSLGLTLVYIPILYCLSLLFPGNTLYRQIPIDPHNPYYPLLLENSPYRYASLIHPVITALTAVLVYALSRQLGFSRRAASVAALVFGLASPAATYARFDYAQPLVSLLLLVACVSYLKINGKKSAYPFLCGLFLGLVILTRPEMIIIAGIPIFLSAFWTKQGRYKNKGHDFFSCVSKSLWFFIPLAVCVSVLLATNQQRFGSPLQIGFSLNDFNFGPQSVLTGLVGSVASPTRGILFFFPVCIFAVIGAPGIFKGNRLAGFLMGWIIIFSIALYSSWGYWSGGLTWGPRFLIPILPYITIMAVHGMIKQKFTAPAAGAAIFTVLVLLGWIGNLQGQLFDSMSYVTNKMMFDFSSSPLFGGWAEISDPKNLDIFWIRKVVSGNPLGYVFSAMIILLLLFCLAFWIKHFQSKNEFEWNFPLI